MSRACGVESIPAPAVACSSRTSPASVVGPDPGRAAAEVCDERVGALLQHGAKLGAAGERETDRRGERGDVLRLLAGAHLLLERRGALRPLAHFDDGALTRHHEEDVLEDRPTRRARPSATGSATRTP